MGPDAILPGASEAHDRRIRRGTFCRQNAGDEELANNSDGSLDVYFGPEPIGDSTRNWIETVPGRGFDPIFPCYSPTAPLFDGTWILPDVEPVWHDDPATLERQLARLAVSVQASRWGWSCRGLA